MATLKQFKSQIGTWSGVGSAHACSVHVQFFCNFIVEIQILLRILTRPDLQRLQHNDRAMIRQICNVKPATVRSNELLARLEIDDLDVILREKRLRWFGHVERLS